MTFKTYQISIDDKIPNETILEQLNKKSTTKYEYNNKMHMIDTEYNMQKNYYWAYFNCNSSNKFNREVYNKEIDDVEKNPRNKSQLELVDQFFIIYTMKHRTLYISDKHKINMVKNYLTNIANQNVMIKAEFTDINKFLDSIDKIKSLRFTTKNNLFNTDKSIYTSLDTILGTEAPESFEIRSKYNNRKLTEGLKNFLVKIDKDCKEDRLETLVLTGCDDSDVEKIYSLNTYIKAIDIEIAKDEDGMYDPIAVKEKVINEIYKGNRNI